MELNIIKQLINNNLNSGTALIDEVGGVLASNVLFNTILTLLPSEKSDETKKIVNLIQKIGMRNATNPIKIANNENLVYLFYYEEFSLRKGKCFLVNVYRQVYGISLLENDFYRSASNGYLILSLSDKIYANKLLIDSLKIKKTINSVHELFEVIYPVEKANLEKRFQIRKKGGNVPVKYRLRYIDANGRILNLSVRVSNTKIESEQAFLYEFHLNLENSDNYIELKKKEKFFDEFISSSQEIYWEYKVENQMIFMSRKLDFLPVNEKSEIYLRQFLRLLNPTDFQKIRFLIERIKRGKQRLIQLEIRLKQSSGRYEWFLLRGFITNIHKSETKIYGTLLPVNHYLKQIHAYIQMQDSLKEFIAHANFKITLFRKDSSAYKLVTISNKFSEFLHINSVLLTNISYKNFNHRLKSIFQGIEFNALLSQKSNSLLDRDNFLEIIPLNSTLSLLLISSFGTSEGQKITKKTSNENFDNEGIITLSRQYFKAILNRVPFGVLVLSRNLKIKLFNEVADSLFNNLYGQKLEEERSIQNQPNYMIFRQLLPYLKKTINGRKSSFIQHFDTVIEGEKWLQFYLYPLQTQTQEVLEIIISVVEITKHKFTEYQLTQAKENAELSDKLKTEFISNMSHEIRTPMNAIIGFSELLQMEITDPEHAEYIDIIINSGQQLLTLIEDIIDISKIESGEAKIKEVSINLNTSLLQIHHFFQNEIKRSGKNIRLLINRSLSFRQAEVYVDEVKLKQILTNLLSNALKFTNSGFIEFGVNIQQEGEKLIFYVKDTGIGISSKHKSIIFKRFAQADGSIRRQFGGTGLGLAITKGLLDLMNGSINVVSEVGKGSFFTFTLPYKAVNKPSRTFFLNDNILDDWSAYKLLLYSGDVVQISRIKEKLLSSQIHIISSSNLSSIAAILEEGKKINFFVFPVELLFRPELQKIKENFKDTKTICIFREASYEEMQKFIYHKIDDFCTQSNIEATLVQVLSKFIKNV